MVYITIMRPVNCIIAFFSVFIGAWIGNPVSMSPGLILAGLIGFAVCAYGNIINDIHDIEIDKINNPDRSLASGKATVRGALILALTLLLLSLFFSIRLGVLPFIIVTGAAGTLYMYARFIKKTLWANFVISLITGMGFLLGGVITHNLFSLFPYVFSFFIHMPREIIKDILDIEGDRSYRVISLPIHFSIQQALSLSALFIGILLVLLPLPFLLRILTVRYMIIVLIGAYPTLLYCFSLALRKPSKIQLKRMSLLYKLSMLVGLLAMVV